jgi:hypothetical protein
MIADAPWHAPNVILRQDLQIPSVKEEIRRFSIHTVPARKHFPTASQFILRNHQNIGD